MGGELAGHHAAERAPHDRGLIEAERVEELVVDQHEVPERRDTVDRGAVGLPGARVVGRVHGVTLGERVEESIPARARGGMQIDDGRSAARDTDLGLEATVT